MHLEINKLQEVNKQNYNLSPNAHIEINIATCTYTHLYINIQRCQPNAQSLQTELQKTTIYYQTRIQKSTQQRIHIHIYISIYKRINQTHKAYKKNYNLSPNVHLEINIATCTCKYNHLYINTQTENKQKIHNQTCILKSKC